MKILNRIEACWHILRGHPTMIGLKLSGKFNVVTRGKHHAFYDNEIPIFTIDDVPCLEFEAFKHFVDKGQVIK